MLLETRFTFFFEYFSIKNTLVLRFFQLIWAFLSVANKQHAIIEHFLWEISGPSSYSL